MTVKDLFLNTPISKKISVKGWVKTFRANRFISLNDGSTFQSIQCVVDYENTDHEILNNINSGASIKITGVLIESQGKGQKIEIKVEKIEIDLSQLKKYSVREPRKIWWHQRITDVYSLGLL